ncbi:uncharacterized protein MYCFIDRAFT_128961 [Pseudocercospora fijiensis CIRAD86]|uniref:NmrA-like domain-containing protein n=1 Tax=Pseudocercospora fijiensis (strain CIRAD86) TaxID=383855 RepID=N1QB57_PSEFD|nr:uncharacterized protein MYCFIDRAFT_128961 [Pseudocercospora fijiensis CIRAD86]EME88303.1 hypothetical protein MYCFIDRAFT_128961 [Pseudocercospora fijiensis CIRAD86]
MSTMRIAIAGTGGLARLIAHYVGVETTHMVVFLSRSVHNELRTADDLHQQQPQLAAAGYQVAVIDYGDIDTLRFSLRGIDTIISTISGPNQIELIKAAVQASVRRFVPSEFEGLPQLRNANDPLDRSRTAARQLLAHYSQRIQSTAFVCGILYERFQPGGLAQSRIGANSGLSAEGSYILNLRTMTGQVPAYDANNNPTAMICMTAAQDVARFVTKSLELHTWPPELRMYGQRVLVKDLVLQIQRLKGAPTTLRTELLEAAAQGDVPRQLRLRALLDTAEGRYDFTQPNLNQHFRDVRPLDFEIWLTAKWGL